MFKRVKETCTEMLQQRGYDIIVNHPNYLIGKTKDKDECIACFITNISKFTVDHIEPYVRAMKTLAFDKIIVVYKGTLTSCAKKTCEMNMLKIQFFSHSELKINITKHILVPFHFRLKSPELDDIKVKYAANIPVLLSSDPISKFYGYSKGDIIKIERADSLLAYRIVD